MVFLVCLLRQMCCILVICCGTACKRVLFHYFLLACIDHWNIFNRLVITCVHSQNCDRSLVFMFHFGKGVTDLGFFVSNCLFFFVWECRNQLVNQAFRTTNTSSYSILSRSKQFYRFFLVTNIRKKFAEFPFLQEL